MSTNNVSFAQIDDASRLGFNEGLFPAAILLTLSLAEIPSAAAILIRHRQKIHTILYRICALALVLQLTAIGLDFQNLSVTYIAQPEYSLYQGSSVAISMVAITTIMAVTIGYIRARAFIVEDGSSASKSSLQTIRVLLILACIALTVRAITIPIYMTSQNISIGFVVPTVVMGLVLALSALLTCLSEIASCVIFARALTSGLSMDRASIKTVILSTDAMRLIFSMAITLLGFLVCIIGGVASTKQSVSPSASRLTAWCIRVSTRALVFQCSFTLTTFLQWTYETARALVRAHTKAGAGWTTKADALGPAAPPVKSPAKLPFVQAAVEAVAGKQNTGSTSSAHGSN